MSEPTQQIDCYVHVKGVATDPDDQSLPGYYQVNLDLSRAVDLDSISENDASQLTKAVLDEFHEKQGIEVLDDFEIHVHLPNGQVIQEIDHPSDDLVESASFEGDVSKSDLPFTAGKARKSRP